MNLAWLALALTTSAACQDQPAGEPLELASALSGAFDDNRAKFRSGTIRFRHTESPAAPADRARKGDLSEAYTAEGELVFNASGAVYSCLFSEADIEATSVKDPELKRVRGQLSSRRLQTDGKQTLYHRLSPRFDRPETIHTVQVLAGLEEYVINVNVPMSLGAPEAARRDSLLSLRSALKNEAGLIVGEVDEDATFEGRQVVRIVVSHENGSITFDLDPERGAIPLRVSSEARMDGLDLKSETYHDDIRLVPGRGWLPYVTTRITNDRTTRIEIVEADFETPVGPERLKLDFAEPVEAFNHAAGWTYAPRKTWSLASIPRPGAPGSERMRGFTSADIEQPGVIEAGGWGRWAWMVVGVLLAVGGLVALVLWWRGRG